EGTDQTGSYAPDRRERAAGAAGRGPRLVQEAMSVPGMVAPDIMSEDRHALSPSELLARRLTNLALSHQRTAREPVQPAAPRAFRSASEYAAVALEDNGISPVRLGRFAQITPLMPVAATPAGASTPLTESEWPAPPLERPWERLIERQTLRPAQRERPWQTLIERYGSNVVFTRTAMVAGVVLLSVVLVSAVCQVARTAEGATIVPHAAVTATPAAIDPDAAGPVASQQSQHASAADVRQALNSALASANTSAPANGGASGAAGSGWGNAASNAGGSPSGWGSSSTQAQGNAAPPVAIPAGAVAIWPVSGPITSFFGPSHPLGIDIGVNTGTPIRAMASGVVTFSGGDPCCSYGYYVDIDHGNGVMTRYGHMVVPSMLRPGQAVRMGDVIGYSGTTGFSTGPHVHFEVRLHGIPVNPLLVLPG
ncbi:MAG TPA: M23 family metallopeptidase, partial [Dehalococcoidia bacterium]|nr:M23 family metallopeptidase [Dehalococcoidia bacterium]